MMSKFNMDYSQLENKVCKTAYRLSDVKDHLESVAFDVVRFKDSDKGADLWQVQSADDGDYIVALYQPEEEPLSSTAMWSVMVNKSAGTLQVSYKGDPLVSLTASKLGIPFAELSKVSAYLPAKLASSPKLVSALLKELPVSVKLATLHKYPELV
jgi:hypothetical protein